MTVAAELAELLDGPMRADQALPGTPGATPCLIASCTALAVAAEGGRLLAAVADTTQRFATADRAVRQRAVAYARSPGRLGHGGREQLGRLVPRDEAADTSLGGRVLVAGVEIPGTAGLHQSRQRMTDVMPRHLVCGQGEWYGAADKVNESERSRSRR